MSENCSRRYKRYLEPNCDPKHRKLPRKTKYRKHLKLLSTTINSLIGATTSTDCGVTSNYFSEDTFEDISISTEAEVSYTLSNVIQS